MTTKVQRSLLVNVPIRAAYDQWTQFEDFPSFMSGIVEVRQEDDRRLHWVAEIAGVKRQWNATILEQVPDQKIAWAATEGATNAGAVSFAEAGPNRTTVTLSLEYEPEGFVEAVGDRLSIVEKQVESDLERFKSLVEARGHDTGGWRGTINRGALKGTPGIEAAVSSFGDKGKAGFSRAAKVAGGLAATVALVASGAWKGAREGMAAARDKRASDETDPARTPAASPSTIGTRSGVEG
jgi:hypothetical protein